MLTNPSKIPIRALLARIASVRWKASALDAASGDRLSSASPGYHIPGHCFLPCDFIYFIVSDFFLEFFTCYLCLSQRSYLCLQFYLLTCWFQSKYFLTALSHNLVFFLKFELRLHSWAISKLSLGSQAAELLEGESRVGGGGRKSPFLMGSYHVTVQDFEEEKCGSKLEMTVLP